jgi:hypothetical protein
MTLSFATEIYIEFGIETSYRLRFHIQFAKKGHTYPVKSNLMKNCTTNVDIC